MAGTERFIDSISGGDRMSSFFRFPRTPHIAWLSFGKPRDDKVVSSEEALDFLSDEVVVEEKVDGANVGFSLDPSGRVRAQNRGEYLGPGAHAQWQPLWPWLDARRDALAKALGPDRMIFGEWCFARHSVPYDRLPDWLLAFDVYDRACGRFWSTRRRDLLLAGLGICPVPTVSEGSFTLTTLKQLLGESRVGTTPMEGIYVRREDDDWLLGRAKLVRPEFVQQIGEHWSVRTLVRNRLARP